MEPLGIGAGLLLRPFVVVVGRLRLLIISSIDLARRRLNGTPLLVDYVVPVWGMLASWIAKPTAESRI